MSDKSSYKIVLKILLVIEGLLAGGTVWSYFATKDATDFSGFLVAYFIFALIIVGFVIFVFFIKVLKLTNTNSSGLIKLSIIVATGLIILYVLFGNLL